MSKKGILLFWDTARRYLDHHLKVIRLVSSHTIDSYRDCLNSFSNYLKEVEYINRKIFLSPTLRRKRLNAINHG